MNNQNFLLILLCGSLLISCGRISRNNIIKGDYYYENGFPANAIKYYKRAVFFNKSSKETYHSIGRVYEDLNLFTVAIENYSKAIEIDSLYALAYRSRGYSNFKIEKYNDALRDYLKSLKIEPNNASAYRNAASNFKELCEYSKAREYYYKSLELEPDYYGAIDDLAGIEFDLGNYDSCITLCYRVLGHLTEGKDSPYGTLGLAYTATQQYDSAVNVLTKAIFYNPDWSHYYNNRGYALAHLHQREKAILDYNLAIELDTLDPTYFLNRADSEYSLSNYANAIKDYNKAIELSKLYETYNCGVCYNNRAHAKRAVGDTEGYRQDLEMAKSLGYPENYKPFSNLESCYYNDNK